MHISKAYIKDVVYLKRNTKFQPGRWGLKTSPASQSSLNETVFRSHERSVKSLRKVDFFKKWLKLAMRFFPKSEKKFLFVFYWLKYDQIFITIKIVLDRIHIVSLYFKIHLLKMISFFSTSP
jgi:hypothetical protein